jgi:endogenous inhibitor of DNA gyrase (YacG/DUF329 family)
MSLKFVANKNKNKGKIMYKDLNVKELLEALKRNEPMKVKTKHVKVSIDDYRIDDYCPTCDEELYTTSNYCPNCGQKLDWSNYES